MRKLHDFNRNSLVISPSLLAADFCRAGAEVAEIAAAGAELLHLDVMDGHLVPNISFGVPVIKSLRKNSDMFFDVHLMISEPLRYAKSFADAGADHLTFHIESNDDPAQTIAAIHDLGLTAGISLRPGTPAEAILPYLDQLDMVLVMTVEPGFGGQSFMPDQLPKIAAFRREINRKNLRCRLEVDGGIGEKNVADVVGNGADTIVAGTAVFRHPEGMKVAVEKLRATAGEIGSSL